MNQFPQGFPTQFESERLVLRSYRPGDGAWYYDTPDFTCWMRFWAKLTYSELIS